MLEHLTAMHPADARSILGTHIKVERSHTRSHFLRHKRARKHTHTEGEGRLIFKMMDRTQNLPTHLPCSPLSVLCGALTQGLHWKAVVLSK